MVLIGPLLVGFNGDFDDKKLLIRLGTHLVTPFWNLETWGMNSGDIWRIWALMCK